VLYRGILKGYRDIARFIRIYIEHTRIIACYIHKTGTYISQAYKITLQEFLVITLQESDRTSTRKIPPLRGINKPFLYHTIPGIRPTIALYYAVHRRRRAPISYHRRPIISLQYWEVYFVTDTA